MPKLRESMVNLIYEIGNHSGCHQIPERSFFYNGRQFPVCARCTGVFIGQIAAIILNFITNVSAIICFFFLCIMGIDWLIQEAGIKESTNRRRFLSGVLGGFGLFNLYCIGIKKVLNKIYSILITK